MFSFVAKLTDKLEFIIWASRRRCLFHS